MKQVLSFWSTLGFRPLMLGFALLCSMVLLSACQPKSTEVPSDSPPHPAWQAILSETPPVWISAGQPLYFRFNRPVVKAEQVGRTEQNRVRFTPDVAVTASWLDPYTLQLTPVDGFPSGQPLQLQLLAENLQLDPALSQPLPDWTQTLQVLSQQFSLREIGFQLAPDAPGQLSYQFEVHTLDPLTLAQLKPLFSLQATTKTAPQLSWQQQSPRLWRGTISAIPQLPGVPAAESSPPHQSTLTLGWKYATSAALAGERSIVIPPLDQFSLLSSQVRQSGSQIFELRFSQPLDAKQNLRGLVQINQQQLRSKIHGNVLQLFAAEKFSQQVELQISRQLKSSSGQYLAADIRQQLQVSSLLPSVKFPDGGQILPAAERLLLPVQLTNAKGVLLRVFQIYPHNMGQFLQQSGSRWSPYGADDVGRYIAQQHLPLPQAALDDTGRYELDVTSLVGQHRGSVLRIEAQILPEDSLYVCDQQLKNAPLVPLNQLSSEGSYRQDPLPERLWRFYQSAGYYDWTEQQNPCHVAYYYGYQDNARASKVFMASNIGLLSKMGQDQQLHILATNLQTGQPMPGAEVEVFNYQQQRIGRVSTGADGLAQVQPQGVPFYLKASHQQDVGYLRMPANDSLPTSQFDTSGVVAEQGLKGFFYAERNVWRPGDDIHLMLILQDKTGQLPDDFPVTLDLFDPRGQKVRTLVQSQQTDGFYRFDLATAAEAPTGNWHAVAKAGGSYFDISLKVENILPNRLKLALNLPEQPLTLTPTELRLQASWLHGAAAPGLKADIELKLKPEPTRFAGYSQYHFDDESRNFSAQPRKILAGQLDAQGGISLQFQPELHSASPGALQALFIQRVFEPNGQFSSQYRQTTLLPYPRFVGLSAPAGSQDAPLDPATPAEFRLLMLSAAGQPQANQQLQLRLQQLRWRWWWERDVKDGSQYQSEELQAEVANVLLTTDAAGQARWTLDGSAYPAGRYLLQVCDTQAGQPQLNHCSSQQLYLGWGYGDEGQRDSASRLEISSDRPDYQPGQQASIQLPAGPARQILLSLENGSQVLEKKMLQLPEGQHSIKIPITSAMAPNVYVHISQFQPHSGRHNDAPLRSYGILNLNVADPASHLQPVLQLPAKVAPESEFTVEIREQQGRAMSYTLALVDEGVLGITDFQVPEPHAVFYQREALGVRSWDLFDQVVGAYSNDFSRLLAVGGSDLQPKRDGQREQRFKPIVQFYGPFRLEAGQTGRQQVKLPPYLGSVRAMVVAGDGTAYGQTQQSLTVSQPLTLLSTAPRVIGPLEQFSLPISLFWSEEGPATVEVTVETNHLLSGAELKQQRVFQGKGEQSLQFNLQAAAAEGMAQITVRAKHGKMTAQEQINLPLRSSNPLQTFSISQLLAAGERWQPKAARLGMAGSQQQWFSASTSPDFALQRHLQQLQHYPHSCVEQRSAALLPQLYLGHYQQLSAAERLSASQQVELYLLQLQSYQQASGRFSYWPGQAQIEAWADLFTGTVLLQAQTQGYALPDALFNSWLKAQQQLTNSFRDGDATALIEHGWRLWLLAQAGQADQGAMNRLREALLREKTPSQLAHWLLALAYAEQGQADVALPLYRRAGAQITTTQPGVWQSAILQQTIQLQLLAVLQRPAERWALAEQLAAQLRQRDDLHTLEQSWALAVLLQQFAAVQGATQPQLLQLSQNGSQTETLSLSDPGYQQALPQYQADGFALTNDGPAPIYLTLTQQGVPAPGEEQASSQGLAMRSHFFSLNGQPVDPATLPQGSDFIARVQIENLSGQDLTGLALQQIFPSGWQLRNAVLADDQPQQQLTWQHAADDRLASYFALTAAGSGRTLTLDVTLNASFSGRFYLPSWQVSAMYQPAIRAVSRGQWVTVVTNPAPPAAVAAQ